MRARGLHLGDLRTNPVDLGEIAGDAAGQQISVDLGLDGDTTGDRVEPAGEPEDRGDFRDANRRGCVTDADEFSLDVGG